MLHREGEAANQPTPEPCEACGKPGECRVWGARVCYPCASDWAAQSPPEREPDEHRRFTRSWLELRRARVKLRGAAA